MTRTFTVYFDEDQVEVLRAHHKALAADLESRGRFIDPDVLEAGRRRLAVLEHAIALLVEKVPE